MEDTMHELEDYADFLDSNPSPAEIAKQSDVIAAGIRDAAERLANVEQVNLEVQHRLSLLEKRMDDAENRVMGYQRDRDEYKQRMDALEKNPIDTAAKLDAIEKRL